MNIFRMSISDASKAIDKIFENVTKEEMIRDLQNCGLEVCEVGIDESIEKVLELLSHKNDCDYAYGTMIYRPYSMSKKDFECIEVLLSEYLQLKKMTGTWIVGD